MSTQEVPSPWLQHAHDAQTRYSIEVSDLRDQGPAKQECPNCHSAFALVVTAVPFPNTLIAHFDRDHDVLFWQGVCKCGSELLVFND